MSGRCGGVQRSGCLAQQPADRAARIDVRRLLEELRFRRATRPPERVDPPAGAGGPGARQFKHDGGEIIFSLPNGLQAYMLATAREALDKGPTNIVLDKEQPDSAVVNGVSCMNCHKYGMIEKADQVRGLAENGGVFAADEGETIKALYPPKVEFDKLLKEDAERFAKAVEKTGGPLSKTEPVFALSRQFGKRPGPHAGRGGGGPAARRLPQPTAEFGTTSGFPRLTAAPGWDGQARHLRVGLPSDDLRSAAGQVARSLREELGGVDSQCFF